MTELTRKSMLKMLREFSKSSLGIDTEPGDDFDSYILEPSIKVYEKIMAEIKTRNFKFLRTNYRNKEKVLFKDLISLARDVFYVKGIDDSENGGYADTVNNREELYKKIEEQKSLDNLSKTGLRAYYEKMGYEDVKVKYDKKSRSLKVFGNLIEGRTTKTETVDIRNGNFSLNLNEDESIEEIEEIIIEDDNGNENIVYSKANMLAVIQKQLATKEKDSAMINKLLSKYSQNYVEINADGTVSLKSPAIAAELFEDVSVYETLMKNSYVEDIKELENISNLCLSAISLANEKIISLNEKTKKIESAGQIGSEVAAQKYKAVMDGENGVITKLASLSEKVNEANDVLAGYHEELEAAEQELEKVKQELNTIPSDGEVEDFINDIQEVKLGLESLLSGGSE